MGNISFEHVATPTFNLADFLAYREAHAAELSPVIWTIDRPDHLRLPGQVDIIEFLIGVGFIFELWQRSIGYAGEKLVYSPKYPDIIYSYPGSSVDPTPASPHRKIPMGIAYGVKRRMPASVDGTMFGRRKNWKYRPAGEFQGADGRIYTIRIRQWENLIEFVAMARSGAEADSLVQFFENFLSLNEGAFLEMGIEKMAPVGRLEEADSVLDKAGVHYRKTLLWVRSQEFQFAGPITGITEIDAQVLTATT